MKRCPNPDCTESQFPDEANFCPSCAQRLEVDAAAATGAPAPAPADEPLGGRFVLGDRIGGNRTGELYAATDSEGGGACVVKLVHDAVFPTPLLKQRTERELKQLERVNAPAVARLLGHGKRGEQLWIATERVDGQSLKSLVSAGVLDVDRARAILLAVGGALAEAAKVGVIHRDVSPKNVLIGAGDAVKLINFGVCTPLSDKVQGEPEFLSPEQCDGKPVDQRSNIYSLGAMFYYMVTGQPPYTGDAETVMAGHRDGELTPPSQLGSVPPAIEAIIVKALEKTSSRRFMTLRQMLGDIERADTTGAADSASSTSPFPAAASGADMARPDAAKTMMGMMAPMTAGHEGPPQVIPVGPGAPDPQPAIASPVAQTAPDTSPPTASPVAQTAPDTAPAPQPAPTPAPQPAPTPMVQQPAPTNGAQAQASAPPVAEPPAPQVPGPQIPAPSVPPQASTGRPGGKRANSAEQPSAAAKRDKDKGKFRETLWFKKGELDAVAAEAAAAAAAQGQDDLVSDKADQMAIEDRYVDDGTVTQSDKKAYSLRTGHTQMMRAVQDSPVAGGMAEDDLVSEMKSGRTKIIALIAVGLIVVIGVVLAFVL